MIHTTLPIHSFEGVMVLVVVYSLSIALCVFYTLWQRAKGKLKEYYRSEESESKGKARNNAIAPAMPIMRGHIESVPKIRVKRISINSPSNRATAIFASIASIVNKLSRGQNGRSINKEKNQIFYQILQNVIKYGDGLFQHWHADSAGQRGTWHHPAETGS
jgi:hypothetical protein